MPDWNRIIVGDAFKLPSRNLRYYLDMILWFPLFGTSAWFMDCFHGWRIAQWDLREAGFRGVVVCLLLLLIKERTIVIASMFGFVAYQLGLASAFHGDVKVLAFSYLFYGGAFLVLLAGMAFRTFVLKKPDFDPTYRRPDRQNSWMGVVLVLGIVFGLGSLGIYLSWR